jgi:hypothetical protein
LISSVTLSSKNKGFELFLHHGAEVDTSLGVNSSEKLLLKIIKREEVYPLTDEKAPPADWGMIYEKVKRKYPRQAEKVVVSAKPVYYDSKGMRKEYCLALVDYVEKLDDHRNLPLLNDYAWEMFLKCDDPAVLAHALGWSRLTFSGQPDPDDNIIDTYANLLYKAGQVKEGILWEQKAMSLVAKKPGSQDAIQKYAKTIERMQKGEKVWESPL